MNNYSWSQLDLRGWTQPIWTVSFWCFRVKYWIFYSETPKRNSESFTGLQIFPMLVVVFSPGGVPDAWSYLILCLLFVDSDHFQYVFVNKQSNQSLPPNRLSPTLHSWNSVYLPTLHSESPAPIINLTGSLWQHEIKRALFYRSWTSLSGSWAHLQAVRRQAASSMMSEQVGLWL